MFVRHNIILHLIIIIKATADNEDRTEKANPNIKVERRFLEDLNDEDWHVAHLKDVDFNTRRSGCKEETVNEKIAKYRRNLKHDAGNLEYVNADPLPFEEQDLDDIPCKDNFIGNVKLKFKDTANVGNTSEDIIKETTVEPIKANVRANTDANSKKTTKTFEDKKEVKDTATTPKIKQKYKKHKKEENLTADEKARRASEYAFSSIEYYDETMDFDESVCPDDVEVIIPDQDIIRNYDVECELTLEWTSLE